MGIIVREGETNLKYILIVIIFSTLVGGAILGYTAYTIQEITYLSQLPEIEIPEKVRDQTANWKTYRNEEYGFEFKYPTIYDTEEYKHCRITEGDKSFRIGSRSGFSIRDAKGLNLSDFVEDDIKDLAVEDKREASVGGKEAITVDYTFGGMDRFGTATFVQRDWEIYEFGFTAGGFICDYEDRNIYEFDVYGKMLSTFRFLE